MATKKQRKVPFFLSPKPARSCVSCHNRMDRHALDVDTMEVYCKVKGCNCRRPMGILDPETNLPVPGSMVLGPMTPIPISTPVEVL
jgi:hypothetical protein